MKAFKYYSTDRLRTILDDERPEDPTEEGTIRAVLLYRFKRLNGVVTLSIAPLKEEDEDGNDVDSDTDSEPYFSHSGCDCCSHGLGNTVYDVIGFDPKAKDVVEVGQICHECLCVEYNGID